MYEALRSPASMSEERQHTIIAFVSTRKRQLFFLVASGFMIIIILSAFFQASNSASTAIIREPVHQKQTLIKPETPIVPETLSCPPVVTCPSTPAPSPTRLPQITPQHAYIFYATNYEYACSVLVNIDRLLHHPTVKSKDARIGVYISNTIRVIDYQNYYILMVELERLHKVTSGRVFYIKADPPRTLINPVSHYKDVLLKLLPFDIATRNSSSLSSLYVPAYHFKTDQIKRMIILDADQLIMRNLDHLFDLPPAEIAAPRMYWGDGNGITTTLMVVQPSLSLWKRMDKALHSIREGEYDMDLVNRVFKKELLALPGRYCTLNSHWEVNEIPDWYHHDAPAYPLTSAALTHGKLDMMHTNYTTLHKGNSTKWRDDQAVGLLNDAEVVHFTALGKPWTWSTSDGILEKPQAHWIFTEMFGEWRASALQVCPGWKERGEITNVKRGLESQEEEE